MYDRSLLLRLLIALPAALLFAGLSYWSATAKPPTPPDALADALALERTGDLAQAEHSLLALAQWDHLYAPRWTLAGFYFRHDRPDDFWNWTRRALNVGTHDLGALFDLCWQVTHDPEIIWQRAIPDRKEIWNEYLAYLLATSHWDAAIPAAARLAQQATADDGHLLLGFCDLAIERKTAACAIPVWNELSRRSLIASTEIGPRHYLVNGNLSHRPLQRGFDWKFPAQAGIRVEWTPGELHIAFSGTQADGVNALTQSLALAPDQRYRFTFRSSMQDIPPGALQWRFSKNGAATAQSSGDFTGPADTLALTCEPKCAGTVTLREMDIVRQ